MSTDGYLDANRELWDARVPHHARSAFYDVEGFKAGRSTLKTLERAELGDVAGKSLLHLQCHFGMDTMSWARLGARVTGVDFSEKAIALARALAGELGIDATFICSSVVDLPDALDGSFDVVFTSYGVLGWLPDLKRWAEVVAHFLAPGGTFYMAEFHPFAWVFDDDEAATEPRVRYSYFHSAEPLALPVKGTYADPAAPIEGVEYAWAYELGAVVTSLVEAGLRVRFVHEFPSWGQKFLPFLEQDAEGRWSFPGRMVPLLFSLKATKD
jgi:SAM-dependent methyltransferase